MTTISQLIEYLQTLPSEGIVKVIVTMETNWSTYTTLENLELPQRSEDGTFCKDSNNLEFYAATQEDPLILLSFGRA